MNNITTLTLVTDLILAIHLIYIIQHICKAILNCNLSCLLWHISAKSNVTDVWVHLQEGRSWFSVPLETVWQGNNPNHLEFVTATENRCLGLRFSNLNDRWLQKSSLFWPNFKHSMCHNVRKLQPQPRYPSAVSPGAYDTTTGRVSYPEGALATFSGSSGSKSLPCV